MALELENDEEFDELDDTVYLSVYSGQLTGPDAVDHKLESKPAADTIDIIEKPGQRRYYDPPDDSVMCFRCKGKGHKAFECSADVQEVVCFRCGQPGHKREECTMEICYECKKPGHKVRDCPNKSCFRCGHRGHLAKDCNSAMVRQSRLEKGERDTWQSGSRSKKRKREREDEDQEDDTSSTDDQYNPTSQPDNKKRRTFYERSESFRGTLITCYNCGEEGHSGEACDAPRMDDIDIGYASSFHRSGNGWPKQKQPSRKSDRRARSPS